MQDLTVIKVGGAIVEDEVRLNQLLDDFANIKGAKVLVHGGGRRATKIASALGIETKMVEGRRVTDKDMLEVVTMVYGGLVNKNIVARLQARGINALGLTGADMNVIRSHKRPPVVISHPKSDSESGSQPFAVEQQTVDYGYVGDVDFVDGQTLASIIQQRIVPVMAPLTHDGKGNMLNTNADTIAAETAKSLAPFFNVTLVYCFEKPGVLANPDDDNSVIPVINRKAFDDLVAKGIVSGGMKPKIENAIVAVESGVKRVVITKADAIGKNKGTRIEN